MTHESLSRTFLESKHQKVLDNTFIEFINIYFTMISIFYFNMYRLILAVSDIQ